MPNSISNTKCCPPIGVFIWNENVDDIVGTPDNGTGSGLLRVTPKASLAPSFDYPKLSNTTVRISFFPGGIRCLGPQAELIGIIEIVEGKTERNIFVGLRHQAPCRGASQCTNNSYLCRNQTTQNLQLNRCFLYIVRVEIALHDLPHRSPLCHSYRIFVAGLWKLPGSIFLELDLFWGYFTICFSFRGKKINALQAVPVLADNTSVH